MVPGKSWLPVDATGVLAQPPLGEAVGDHLLVVKCLWLAILLPVVRLIGHEVLVNTPLGEVGAS